MIIHLMPGPKPQKPAEPYHATLPVDGFIHCSYEHQVPKVLELFFKGAGEVWGFEILTDKLTSELRDDPTPLGEAFPHVYGPINPEAFGQLIRFQ